MTTIAYHYRDKQVAVDSRVTAGSEILTDKQDKSIKNDCGIWIFAGNNADFVALSKLKHDDEIKVRPDCSALLIKGCDVYHVTVGDDRCCVRTLVSYNYALGSGGDFATGAMDHGKSAREAVKYAMTRDSSTGGRIKTFNLS